MPGLGMEPTNGHQSSIKNEAADVDGYQSEGDNHIDEDFIVKEELPEDDGIYKPRPQLGEPFVGMRPLSYLMSSLEDGSIDVDPEYQREVVWTGDRMTGLINSLMENYYIPPIILNKKVIPTGGGASRTLLVCVDGKQRLSSVRAFVQGLVHCHDYRGEKWWFRVAPGSTRVNSKRVLPEAARVAFLAKEFVTFEFNELSQEQEEDLFARVQMGVQLSAAEKMRAQTGPWQELARLYVDHFPSIFALLKNTTRAKDFQMALSCFSQILEVQHPTNADGVPILRTNFVALPKLLQNTLALDADLKSHYRSVFATFAELIEMDSEVFTNTDRKLKGVQTFAPVELVAVSVLISMYSDTRNNRLLLGDIRAMRNHIRDEYSDIRMNAPMWTFLWNWIDNLEGYRGAVRGPGRPAREVLSTPVPASVPAPVASPAKSASRKRGRPVGSTKYSALPVVSYGQYIAGEERRPERETPASATPKTKRPKIEQQATPTPTSIPIHDHQFGSSTEAPLIVDDEGPMDTATTSTTSSRPPQGSLPPSKKKSRISAVPKENLSILRTQDETLVNKHRPRSPLAVAEARASRISELNGFRVPTAPSMAILPKPPPSAYRQTPVPVPVSKAPQRTTRPTPTPQPTTTVPVPITSQHVTQTPSPYRQTQVPLPSRKSIDRAHTDDSPAVQIDDQLQAALQLSRERPLDPAPLSSRSRTSTDLAPHSDEPIDLTSDTEQERQSLLSSFHSRSATTKIKSELERQELISNFKTSNGGSIHGGRRMLGSTKENSVMIDGPEVFPIQRRTVRKGPKPTRGGFSG
ncbi:hypothetical protein P154DRAFT_518746 [Amniculicola lignicola CBS 123094]|uniref:GmrSD restriction endonucleases N-terminal domain-containing protein n=1 Tax=Amniculicola lignicola CBS 123094 TaxID=1392246 RepID=A0A6A5WYG5_9PLEO|nr:hypothetical protein P154DRAFT_518746 [Amniculicola lignicola CBS 123094]